MVLGIGEVHSRWFTDTSTIDLLKGCYDPLRSSFDAQMLPVKHHIDYGEELWSVYVETSVIFKEWEIAGSNSLQLEDHTAHLQLERKLFPVAL